MKVIKRTLSENSSVFLNIVRVVASELVVIGHFLTKYQPTPFDPIFRLGSTIGGAAVLLFFVLSGFLVSYSLLRKIENPQYGFRSYFIDRFSRIYSGLLPALLLSAVIAIVIYITNYAYYAELSTMQSAPSGQTFIMTLFMLERFPTSFFNALLSGLGLSFPLPQVTPFGFNGILWTLVVEWWIYMFFGALVIGGLTIAGKRDRNISYQAIISLVSIMFGLIVVGFSLEFTGPVVAWSVGALFTVLFCTKTIMKKFSKDGTKSIAQGLLLICWIFAFIAIYATFAWINDFYNVYLGIALSTCILLTVVLLNNDQKGATKKLKLNHIAKRIAANSSFSYTLFLTHYPIVILLNGLELSINRWLMLIPILLLTNIVAYVIAHFSEKRSQPLASTIKRILNLP
jgi:peptidoglycan/LPS O-acetylase OafA/YrhL